MIADDYKLYVPPIISNVGHGPQTIPSYITLQFFHLQAQAANEVSQLAAGDNRLLILGVVFVPALGWVAFNILGPALNQLANMATANGPGAQKGKKGGKGRR